MSIRAIYRAHRWLAVGGGVFLLIWLSTGIVMVMPPIFSTVPRERGPEPIDLRQVTLSPAEAVETLRRERDARPRANGVVLKQVGDVVAYEFDLAGQGTYLVDARSGRLLTITPDLADRIARARYPSDSPVVQVDHLTEHSFDYPFGALPAYRIVRGNDGARVYYVAERTGAVLAADRWARFQAVMDALHTFEPLKLIVRGPDVASHALILASTLGIAVAATGYALALPRRRRS